MSAWQMSGVWEALSIMDAHEILAVLQAAAEPGRAPQTIVKKHLQARMNVINLYPVNIVFRLGAVYCKVSQIIGSRESCHGYHLIRQLFNFIDA